MRFSPGAERLAADLPGVVGTELSADTGHLLMEQCPAGVARHIDEFLARPATAGRAWITGHDAERRPRLSAAHSRRRDRKGLQPWEAAGVYDRIGRLLVTQAPIERAAVDRLVRAGKLAEAGAVFELGCGTGSLARRLLDDVLPAEATYAGGDVSPRMVALARHAVAPWSARAEVIHLDGNLPLPRPDGSADRFVAAYVLDLLEPEYALRMTDDAHRVLAEGGLLCVSSLTWGRSASGRAISAAWMRLWWVAPRLVGGCRPIRVRELLDPKRWKVHEDTVVQAWGVPSEVLVAERAS